jgi:biopolymer transport protein ExbD
MRWALLALACATLPACHTYREDLEAICRSTAADPSLAGEIHTRQGRRLFADMALFTSLPTWADHLGDEARAQGVVRCALAVDLRAQAAVHPAPHPTLEVTIDRDGSLLEDGRAVKDDAWLQRLDERVKKDSELRAVIAADGRVPYDRVVHVIDLLKSHGVSRFSLQVETDGGAVAR